MFRHRKLVLAAVLLAIMLWERVQADAPTAPPPAESEPTGQLIEGLVLNHFGGGIAGARVRIESLDASADDPPLAEGTANNTGEIAIQLLKPAAAPVRVRIQADGYVDWVQEIDPTNQDDPPFIDATLAGAARLTGTVRAKGTDKPVGGAVVGCDNGGRQLQVRTDSEGRYEVNNVFRGPATLTVSADGFGIERKMVRVDSDSVEAEIELAPARPVEFIVVTNNGRPAPAVTIEAVVQPMNYYVYTETDEAGRATLDGVSAEAAVALLRLNGPQYVRMTDFAKTIPLTRARSPSTAPASAPAPVRQRLVVTVGATVLGKVTAAESGKPIVGVRVVAGRQAGTDMPMTWTSLDGTYELAGVRPGIVTVSFQHADCATAIREADLYTGKRYPLDVQLVAGQPIAGQVVDAQGKPLEQVWVSGDDWKGYATLGLRTITGEGGTFSLPHAPPGEIGFSFLKPGYGPPVQEVLTAGRTDYRIVVEAGPSPPAPAGSSPKIATGAAVGDLTLTAVDGTVYKLAELRGKYVFLDYWASWCRSCRAEVPNVKALDKATRQRADFLLIGVSLDNDREVFKQVVEDNEMDWPQVFGEKSGARESFEMLNGREIPYTCLIGPDGKILVQNLRGPEMVKEVEKHLPE